jgi:putative intracellular protease/amidase
MPSNPAKPAKPRRIAFVAFDGALATDIAGPSDDFGIVNRLHEDETLPALPKPAYEIRYLSLRGGPIRASSGLILETEEPSAKLLADLDTLIVSGGSWMLETIEDKALVRWIAKAAPRPRRICSVCSGAFLLAEAGLLDGRNAVTHWAMSDAFRARYPKVKLALDPIFVEDGKMWSSAGVTAGIDLALALIRRDHGPEIATRVAKQRTTRCWRSPPISPPTSTATSRSMRWPSKPACHPGASRVCSPAVPTASLRRSWSKPPASKPPPARSRTQTLPSSRSPPNAASATRNACAGPSCASSAWRRVGIGGGLIWLGQRVSVATNESTAPSMRR